MKSARMRTLLFVAGLLLIVWGISPRLSVPAAAAPSMLITETPTAEPPSPTPGPTQTGFAPSPTPPPTSTIPAPTNTALPGPTSTPEPPPDNPDRRDTPTPTPLPTLTPTPLPAGPGPDPAVSKSVSPPSAIVGDTVVYTIVVSNLGGAPATGVVVEDTLPGFLTLVGATATRGTVTTSGQSVRVEIGDLAPGETVEVQVTARVNAPAAAPNNRNLAVVSSSSPDINPDNNQASVPVDAAAPASLPNTSGEGAPALPLLAAALGLALVAASILMGRSARRTRG